MHGIEEQTKESIRILLSRKTPFVVALNKIDRLYQWKSYPDLPVEEAFKKQDDVTLNDFNTRFKGVIIFAMRLLILYLHTNYEKCYMILGYSRFCLIGIERTAVLQ